MNTRTNCVSNLPVISTDMSRDNARTFRRAAAAVGFAVATALAANVTVPLPGTPVPMTLQTLVVMLAGVTLGLRWGTLSMAFYVLLGTAGYHAFAGGSWGLMTVIGATGGYLFGFVLAQPIAGRIAQTPRHSFARLVVAVTLGDAVLFACGLIWLHAWTGESWAQTFAWGLWPFLGGELIKIALAASLARVVGTRIRRWF